MRIITLDITLRDTDPAVTRTLQVPVDLPLDQLHLTLQAAMGWDNTHLYQFCVGMPYQMDATRWVMPDFVDGPADLPADDCTLEQALAAAGQDGLTYLYDFGDDWMHDIKTGETRDVDDATSYPKLVDASGQCPPEDIGGPPGFDMFKAAMKDRKHPEHRHYKDWHGGPFDPAQAPIDDLQAGVQEVAQQMSR